MEQSRAEFIAETIDFLKETNEEVTVNQIANMVYEWACGNSDELGIDFETEGSGEDCKQSEAPEFYDSIGNSWESWYRDAAIAMQSVLDEIYESV